MFPNFANGAEHIAAWYEDTSVMLDNPGRARTRWFKQLEFDNLVVFNKTPIGFVANDLAGVEWAARDNPYGAIGEACGEKKCQNYNNNRGYRFPRPDGTLLLH